MVSKAMARFDIGPATETSRLPIAMLIRRVNRTGLTGTGFAQPNGTPNNGSSTVPTRSMWASGFSVRRPR